MARRAETAPAPSSFRPSAAAATGPKSASGAFTRRASARAASSLSRSETPEEEADAVAVGRTGNVGAGIREQGGRRLPAGEHGVAPAEVGEDRGRSFGVGRRPASSARSAAGGACKPARAPGDVARPAGVRRALDRVTGEIPGGPSAGVRLGGADRVAGNPGRGSARRCPPGGEGYRGRPQSLEAGPGAARRRGRSCARPGQGIAAISPGGRARAPILGRSISEADPKVPKARLPWAESRFSSGPAVLESPGPGPIAARSPGEAPPRPGAPDFWVRLSGSSPPSP